MAGSRRGPRYGLTKSGPVDIDPDSPDRRIGSHLRELRIQSGMTRKQLAEAMRCAGFDRWNEDIVGAVQTGRASLLYCDELPTLAELFGITVDQFLSDALGDIAGPINAVNLHPADLLKLARIAGATVDQLLAIASANLDAHGASATARSAGVSPKLADRLGGKPVKWVQDMPPFQGYEGQREEIDSIAKEVGMSRNELCRQALKFFVEVYRNQ